MKLLPVGHTRKPFGKDGFLKVFIESPYDEIIENLRALFITIEGSDVPFLISKIRINGNICVKFQGLHTPQALEFIVNRNLSIHVDELPAELKVAPSKSTSEFLHYTIQNASGEKAGQIIKIEAFPYQLMATVQNARGKTFLCPIHENIIQDIDHEAKILVIDIPEGLIPDA